MFAWLSNSTFLGVAFFFVISCCLAFTSKTTSLKHVFNKVRGAKRPYGISGDLRWCHVFVEVWTFHSDLPLAYRILPYPSPFCFFVVELIHLTGGALPVCRIYPIYQINIQYIQYVPFTGWWHFKKIVVSKHQIYLSLEPAFHNHATGVGVFVNCFPPLLRLSNSCSDIP